MSFKGMKNIYICKSCGHGFVALDVDHGTTPFTTSCLNCNGMAQSLCYKTPQVVLQNVKPAREWYIPSSEEFEKLSDHDKDHVKKGGLLLRKPK